MANSYGLNSSQRVGEGDANILSWGNLDRAANQIYQEQKQREARGYNDYLQGQAALQKEFANVRSADIPDVVNSYNDLKRIKQQMLFNDKVKNNPIELAKIQEQANEKEKRLRKLMAQSRELKETDKAINQRMLSHPDDFDENAGSQFAQHLNLPLAERYKMNAIGVTPYLYKGVDMDKLGALSKQAAGTPTEVPYGQPTIADEGYKIQQNYIKRGANPLQYAESMYKGFQTNKMGQGARFLLNQMTPEKISQVIQKYNDIPDKEFEEKWGVPKSALTNGFLADDKAAQYVLLDAMNYAVNNMPTESAPKFRPNEAFRNEKNKEEFDRRNEKTYKQALEKQARGFAHSEKMANLGADATDQFIQNARTGTTYAGKEGENIEKLNIKPIIANEYKITEEIPKDQFEQKLKDKGLPYKTKKIEIIPDFGLGKDGKVYAIQYQTEQLPDGEIKKTDKIDWTKTKEVPSMQFKSTIINKALPSNYKTKSLMGNPKISPTKDPLGLFK